MTDTATVAGSLRTREPARPVAGSDSSRWANVAESATGHCTDEHSNAGRVGRGDVAAGPELLGPR